VPYYLGKRVVRTEDPALVSSYLSGAGEVIVVSKTKDTAAIEDAVTVRLGAIGDAVLLGNRAVKERVERR